MGGSRRDGRRCAQGGRGRRGRAFWLAQLAGVVLMIGATASWLIATGAGASTLTNGPVTLDTTPSNPVAAGTPYSSGQSINIEVAANSTLSLTNLESYGFSGEPKITFLECSDPGGLVANLPTKLEGECDTNTGLSLTNESADGSMTLDDYEIFALPDYPIFDEPADSTPVCDASDACVIGIFSNQEDFTDPMLFSAPFYVTPNADDGGENPGDGSEGANTATSATNSTVIVAPTTSQVANGVDTSQVTVTLKDTTGAVVVAPKQLSITQSGQSTIDVGGTFYAPGGATAAATTGGTSTGTATFGVTDETAQTVTYTVTDTTDGVTLPTFTVTFVAPVATAANSTIAAAEPSVALGGSTTVTVTVKDQGSPAEPVSGQSVALSQGAGHSVITTSPTTTNSSGQAVFTVSDDDNETVIYSAMVGGTALSQTASVEFGTPSTIPSAATSTVTASANLASTAGAPITVTVTLLGFRRGYPHCRQVGDPECVPGGERADHAYHDGHHRFERGGGVQRAGCHRRDGHLFGYRHYRRHSDHRTSLGDLRRARQCRRRSRRSPQRRRSARVWDDGRGCRRLPQMA